MVKKTCVLLLSVLVTISILSSCTIDVNKIASNFDSSNESSSTAFYESTSSKEAEQTDSDVDVPDTDSQLEAEQLNQPTFDTSAYKTLFITGAASIEVYSDANGRGSLVGALNYGESVSFIKSVAGNDSDESVSFVYSETLGNFGYVKNVNLVELYDEVTFGEIYYAATEVTPLYGDEIGTYIIRNLSKNEMVTVIAKLSSGVWRVCTKSGTIGYASSYLLSEEKIQKKASSSKSENNNVSKHTESKVESKFESKTESRVESYAESVAESKTSSTNEPSVYTGEGEAPTSGYTLYTVDVDIGYLALRSEASAETSKEIGQLYYGEYVDVIDSSGEFWYIYAPSCGKYGFVKGDSGYLVYAEYYDY